jgi:lipoate---protein ligase
MQIKPQLQVLFLENLPVFTQLSLEQSLLSLSSENYLIIHKSPKESVVMGISGKKEQLVYEENLKEDHIPLIKRYSGGGCVYLDNNSLMLSYIFNKKCANHIQYPLEIMQWSFDILSEVFKDNSLSLQENDYTLGEKKFGGNAQYIKKDRFCHHSSLLYRCNFEKMAHYLKLPEKIPDYRKKRSHKDFLKGFEEYFSTKESFIDSMKEELGQRYALKEISFESVNKYLDRSFRNSNKIVT